MSNHPASYCPPLIVPIRTVRTHTHVHKRTVRTVCTYSVLVQYVRCCVCSTYVRTYVRRHTHTHTNPHTHTHTRTHRRTCARTHPRPSHTHTHIHSQHVSGHSGHTIWSGRVCCVCSSLWCFLGVSNLASELRQVCPRTSLESTRRIAASVSERLALTRSIPRRRQRWSNRNGEMQ